MTDRWVLGIDFGTSYTAAATASGGRVEALELDGSTRLTSLILVGSSGEIVVGRAAERQAPQFPSRVERAPKRYLGLPRPMLIEGRPVRAVEAVAAIFQVVLDEARRRHGGTEPAAVRLTHPARWGPTRIEALVEAASLAGIRDPELIAEPVAAAMYLGRTHLEEDGHVAVYDLGGGTFDTAVLERRDGAFSLAGPPGGQEDLGGDGFDEALFRYLGGHLAPDIWDTLLRSDERRWRTTRAVFRTGVRDAKEALSRDQTFTLALPMPIDAELQITRGEFEDLIRFDVKRTISELTETIRAAALAPQDIADVYLVGGSSRIPLVSRLLTDALGRQPTTWDDPKVVVALGAASAPLAESTLAVPTAVAVAGLSAVGEEQADGSIDRPAEDTQPALLVPIAAATEAGAGPPAQARTEGSVEGPADGSEVGSTDGTVAEAPAAELAAVAGLEAGVGSPPTSVDDTPLGAAHEASPPADETTDEKAGLAAAVGVAAVTAADPIASEAIPSPEPLAGEPPVPPAEGDPRRWRPVPPGPRRPKVVAPFIAAGLVLAMAFVAFASGFLGGQPGAPDGSGGPSPTASFAGASTDPSGSADPSASSVGVGLAVRIALR